MRLFHYFCGFYHRPDLAAINLNGGRALAVGDMKFSCGGSYAANEGIGRNKFSIGEVGALLFTYQAK